MNNTRFFTIMIMLTLVGGILFAQGANDMSGASRYDSYAGNTSMGPKIVASTSWVGAIVEASGGRQVQILAPVELRHPPEYDFSPQDIIDASRADLVFWAGYEGFVKNLVRAANISENRLVRVNTNNAPDQLAESVRQVALLLDTTDHFESWKRELDALDATMLEAAEKMHTKGMRAAVQFHHQAFARYLGYEVVYVFGPQELTLNDIRAIEELDVDVVIDNWHSVQGESFRSPARKYVQLVNFPGPFGTKGILDVLRYNARQLALVD